MISLYVSSHIQAGEILASICNNVTFCTDFQAVLARSFLNKCV